MVMLSKEKLARFRKRAIIVYGALFTVVVGLFFRFTYVRLRDDGDLTYNVRHNVYELGLSQLRGNEMRLVNPFVIAVLVVGVVVGLWVLFDKQNDILMFSAGLLTCIGSVVPFMPPYDENLLARMLICVVLTAFSVIMQIIMLAIEPKPVMS
jgi:hypothetical protein